MKNLALVLVIIISTTVKGQVLEGMGEINRSNPDFPWQLMDELIEEGVKEVGIFHKDSDGYTMLFNKDNLSIDNFNKIIAKTVEILNINGRDQSDRSIDETIMDIDLENFNSGQVYPRVMVGDEIKLVWDFTYKKSAARLILVMKSSHFALYIEERFKDEYGWHD